MSLRSQRITRIAVALGAMLLFAIAAMLALHGPFFSPSGIAASELPAVIVGKLAGIIFIVLSSLPVLTGFWVGAIGLGIMLQQRLLPQVHYRFVTQLTLGLASLLLFDWLLGWVGLMNPWTAWLLPSLGTAAVVWHVVGNRNEAWHIEHWVEPPWTLLLCLPPAALLLVAACIPPGALWSVEAFGYDAISYHLQLPREWLALDRMAGLEHNVYSYLPNLVEAGYLHITAMHGQLSPSAIYTAQLLHASMALVAAAIVACMVSRLVGRAAGVLAAAIFLATPWVLITASLAYDEMAALALAGGAMLLASDHVGRSRRGAAVIGLLLGAATLAKLTIGVMLAPGLILIIALDWWGISGAKTPLPDGRGSLWARGTNLGIILVVMALTISPYLIRNAVWTGNPVFPFATQTLGRGHWTPELAERWRRAHATEATLGQRLSLLNQRGLTNAGFGALGGLATKPDANDADITRFGHHAGFPLFWLACVAGAVASLLSPALRRAGLAMLLMLGIAALIWLFTTHLQSRFLLPLMLPACVLLGLGAGHAQEKLTFQRRGLFAVLTLTLSLPLIVHAYAIFHSQTVAGLPPWQLVDSLATPGTAAAALDDTSVGYHPINQLSPTSRTLIVADNGRLIYLQRPFSYASAFDQNVLGTLIRQLNNDPARVTDALKMRGFTHVWVNWSELHRLASTYGYDPALTRDNITALANAAGWQWFYHDPSGYATLFALP